MVEGSRKRQTRIESVFCGSEHEPNTNSQVLEANVSRTELNIANLSESEFIDNVKFKDYYIYSKDKSILFAISWDDFFYFIATKKENIEVVNDIAEIEGFMAKEKDSHLWDWEEGEIEKILNASKNSKKESWWKRLIKKRN